MATFSRQVLSGSTNGKGIKVAATSTPGTTLHTAISGTTSFDEVWLWAVNSDTATIKLTVEFGGTTSPDDTIELFLPPESGLIAIVPGFVLQNSLVVKAFAASANVVLIHGFVNRIA